MATITLIGKSLGRKHPEVAKRYGTICQEIGLVISVFLSIMYLLFREWFYSLYFPGDELAISIGTSFMWHMTVIILLQISQVIYIGALRDVGDVKYTLFVSIIGVTLARPLAAYLFSYVQGLGIVGTWAGVIVD